MQYQQQVKLINKVFQPCDYFHFVFTNCLETQRDCSEKVLMLNHIYSMYQGSGANKETNKSTLTKSDWHVTVRLFSRQMPE